MLKIPHRINNRLFLCGIGFVLLTIGAISALRFLIVLFDQLQIFPIVVELDGSSHEVALLKSALVSCVATSIGISLILTGRKLPRVPLGGQGG